MDAFLNSKRSGHSASVEMAVIVDGVAHRLAQMGPNFVILDKPANHPPCNAELVLDIDGSIDRWMVYLPKGLPENERRIPLARAA